MRTTVTIDDELLAAAKRAAAQRGTSLGAVVEAGLRRELNAVDDAEAPELPVFTRGTGPRPGIDLSSNRALHEALDEGLELDQLR